MKRITYIALAIVFGILVQFVLHAVVELGYIHLLVTNFDRWSFGLSWSTWFSIHTVASIVLLVAGIIVGYFLGVHWWKYIYVEKHPGLLGAYKTPRRGTDIPLAH